MTVLQGIALALILLTPLDWWAVVVCWWARRQHPEVAEVRRQGQRYTLAAVAATAIAATCVAYLVGWHMPPWLGSTLLIGALFLPHVLCAHFLIVTYYRRR